MFWWAWLGACDDTTFPVGDGTGADAAYADVVAVFTADCLACHSAAILFGGLDLETAPCSALVGVPSQGNGEPLVVPGDAAGSVLWSKLGPTPPFGEAMPPPDGGLSDEAIALVGAWIDGGAVCTEGP
jgi:hypothetical protein